MKKEAINKTNIFKIEIIDRKPQNNIININENINKESLFKIKKTNEKNKNEIISNINYEKNKKNEETIISSINNVSFPIKNNENEESIINILGGMEERKLSLNYPGNSDDKHCKKEIIQNQNEYSGVCNNNNLIEITTEKSKIEEELNKKGSKILDEIRFPGVDTKERALDIHDPKFGTNIKELSLDISEPKISADKKGSALAINWTKIVKGIDKKNKKYLEMMMILKDKLYLV